MPIRKDGKIKVEAIMKDGKIKTVTIPEYCTCSDCASKPPSKRCVCPICESPEDDDDVSLDEWDLPSDYIGQLPDYVWDNMEKGQLEKVKAETNIIKKAKNTFGYLPPPYSLSQRRYRNRLAAKYLNPPKPPLDEVYIRYYHHHHHHRDDLDDQDSTEDDGSKKSRTKKKKKRMPRMETRDQASKLRRTEKKSQKDAIEGLELEMLNLEAPPLEEILRSPRNP